MGEINNLFIAFKEIIEIEKQRAKMEAEHPLIGPEMSSSPDMVFDNAANAFLIKFGYTLSKEEVEWMKSLSS